MLQHPPPSVPWQLTGNHWISVPCIHPGDASIHAIGMVNRSARAAVEFAGGADFLSGTDAPLIIPRVVSGTQEFSLDAGVMAWERPYGWLPTFSAARDDLTIRGTICAPYGRDADIAGFVYVLSVENRSARPVTLRIELSGTLGYRQQRVRSARAFDDAHRVALGSDLTVLLDGAALPSYGALAIGTDGEADASVAADVSPFWSIGVNRPCDPGERVEVAFYIGAGPERDGAEGTVKAMRRRGWRELVRATRASLQSFEQRTGNESLDRLLNRNLLFCHFGAVARAIDDAHFYLVRTRVPWNGYGLTVTDWEALSWIIPAVQLLDPDLARELIIRTCELHGYAPGSGVHYLDGTLFQPGFSLEGAAAYALAVNRYVEATGDDRIVEDPAIGDTLYQTWDDIEARRNGHVPLYATEVTLSGEPPAYPYTAHGNAVTAQALEVLKRVLEEKDAAQVEDSEAVRAELRRRFATSTTASATLNTSTDLAGGAASSDDPVGSVYWLSRYGAISRDDEMYRSTLALLDNEPPHYLATQCARLAGPRSREIAEWLRRASLDRGFAAEIVNERGAAVANGGDAALAGLLAYTLWNAAQSW